MGASKPQMAPLLDERSTQNSSDAIGRRKLKKTFAGLLVAGIVAGFLASVLTLVNLASSNVTVAHLLRFVLPLLTMTMFMLVLPLVFYLSFQDEFGNLNPLIPTHYCYLAKKSFQAILNNDFKVEAKAI